MNYYHTFLYHHTSSPTTSLPPTLSNNNNNTTITSTTNNYTITNTNTNTTTTSPTPLHFDIPIITLPTTQVRTDQPLQSNYPLLLGDTNDNNNTTNDGDDYICIVMEYCNGGDLGHYIEDHQRQGNGGSVPLE